MRVGERAAVVRVVRVTVTLLLAATASTARAQGQPPPQSPAPPTRRAPLQLPSTLPSQIFLGGVPSGTATREPITITAVDAVRRALEHNLGVLTAEEQLGRAQGARWLALAAVLPNINARVSETRQILDLEAFGFKSGPDSPFGNLPSLVGPFNVFDARVFLSQSVFDVGAINTTRAEAHNVSAAQFARRSMRDFVIHVAGDLYVEALAASARVDAARAQRDTAQTLYTQAVDLKNNGLVAGIDVLRAQVQVTTQTQRVTAAVNEFEKTKLLLARVIGLPLGQPFALDPNLPDLPTPDLTLEQTADRAYQQRSDYQAALERVRAAEAARRAVVGEALPSVRVNADYGGIGLTLAGAQATFALTGALNIPIFQGGRTRGRLLEADADLRQRRAEAEDLKASIYYELEAAYLDLQATREQLEVATRGRDLAAQQLVQSRDRFAAGVASNIEVVQAQEAVALATEQFISAQFGYDLAKGALIRGVGGSEDVLRQIIGGTR